MPVRPRFCGIVHAVRDFPDSLNGEAEGTTPDPKGESSSTGWSRDLHERSRKLLGVPGGLPEQCPADINPLKIPLFPRRNNNMMDDQTTPQEEQLAAEAQATPEAAAPETPAEAAPEQAPVAEAAPEQAPAVEAAPAAPAVEDDCEEDFAKMLEMQEQDMPQARVQKGQKVKGRVVSVADELVFVDIGAKIEGCMEKADFRDAEGNVSVAVGDEVEAYITHMAVAQGEIRLSRSMSGAGMQAIEDARENGVPVDGRVTEQCKGGYHVEVLGKTAFCPGSQMAHGTPESLVGQTFQFLVTRVESRGRNIVVSHRALLDRQREQALEALLEEVREGDVVEGTVTRIASFGAFVELVPGVEGMVHLSELSWSRVMKADEVVQPGDTVQAKILRISKEKGRDGNEHTRISLSIKEALGNPWDDIENRVPAAGSIVDGKVMRIAPFGAFVEIAPGIEGLVHLSEMSWTHRVVKADEVVKPGDIVRVKIKDINPQNHRVSLSLRDAQGNPWEDVETRFPVGSVVEGRVESLSKFGLFVSLAPGITGLLPEGIMRQTKTEQEYQKLQKDDPVTLEVQRVDAQAQRITLVPEGMQPQPREPRERREKSSRKGSGRSNEWDKYQKSEDADAGDMNTLARALQDAMQNKQS